MVKIRLRTMKGGGFINNTHHGLKFGPPLQINLVVIRDKFDFQLPSNLVGVLTNYHLILFGGYFQLGGYFECHQI